MRGSINRLLSIASILSMLVLSTGCASFNEGFSRPLTDDRSGDMGARLPNLDDEYEMFCRGNYSGLCRQSRCRSFVPVLFRKNRLTIWRMAVYLLQWESWRPLAERMVVLGDLDSGIWLSLNVPAFEELFEVIALPHYSYSIASSAKMSTKIIPKKPVDRSQSGAIMNI